MCFTELLKKNQNKNFVKKRISWITKYFGGLDPMNELNHPQKSESTTV